MLFDEFSGDLSLMEAAEDCAGNWQDWSSFAWLGSDDCPNNDDICLGYLVVNADPTIDQLVHAKYVRRELDQWWSQEGLVTEDDLVSDFGSSVAGDKNVLGGIAIRVFDKNGDITEPFKKLYEIAQKFKENSKLDETLWEATNKAEYIAWLTGELSYINKKVGAELTVDDIFSILEENDSAEFDDDIWGNVAEVVEELTGKELEW